MSENTIKLDRERTLRIDANALADAEEKLGAPILEKIGRGRLGIREIRALLWAGLCHEDAELTLERAGDFITAESLTRISKALNGALNDFFAPKK